MENILSSTNCNGSGNIIQQNINSRPKFRPLRIKALLDSCASDDDESEDKPHDSDDDTDTEDLEQLPEDLEDELIFDGPYQSEGSLLNLHNKDNGTNPSKNSYSKEKNEYKSHYDGIQSYKCMSENSNASISVQDKFQNVTDNTEEAKQNSQRFSGSASYHRLSSNDKLHAVSTSSHAFECNINVGKNVSLKLSSAVHSSCDNKNEDKSEDIEKNPQDISQRCTKSNSTLDTITEHQLQTSKTDQKQHDFHKSTYSDSVVHISQKNINVPNVHTQQTNKVFEFHEAALGTRDKHSQSQNSLFSESSSEQAQASRSGRQHVVETPLKHGPLNSSRPNPCLSHKSLFQTPQNKVQTTLSTSHAQTPAAIFCHRSQSHMGQTPLQSKVLTIKNNVQTPTQSIFASNGIRNDTPRFFGMECKGVRRPLADTAFGNQCISNSSYSSVQSDLKPRYLHGSQLSNVQEIVSDDRVEQQSKKSIIITSSNDKDTIETNSKKNTHLKPKFHEETKENEPNMIGESTNNGQPSTLNTLQNTILKSKHIVIGTSVNVKDVIQHNNKSKAPTIHSEYKEVQNHCLMSKYTKLPDEDSNDNKHSQKEMSNGEKLNQGANQIVQKMTEIQYSIPCTTAKTKQRKTICVKNKEYLILGTLGQGMSGEVFRVQDVSSSELRAIKCVNLSCMEKDAAQGCLQEISMLCKLQAPCVVRMFDYEVKSPMVYVVMEMGDTDLSRLLKSMSQEKQLPLTMILYYWTEMLTAVKYIHDNGVIHSDLKPANFLLVRGRLKLIDFGIASSLNSDATSVVKNCPIGTLNYISPEALMDIGGNGEASSDVKYKITFKSDVWSLGCILYSLVYGHTPFQHIRSQWAKITAITNPKLNISFPLNKQSSEGQNNTGFSPPPPILIDVMKKCLQHDPKARPTVTQLLQIQYVPIKPAASSSPLDIPGHILVKIKNALSEGDWRQFIHALEKRHT